MKRPFSRTRRRLIPRALAALALALLAIVPLATAASAHGSVVDPASRNYGCWLRWGSDFQNPAMAQQDPMCWQAWQTDVNAMWNWNGLYREGAAGNFQAVIPDGQLCSAGRTEAGRYRAMDNPGDWKATNVRAGLTIKLQDQARHGADYILVYVTKQGFNPLTQKLTWGDLQLVTKTARYAPAEYYNIPVNLSGRSGRAVFYTIWQASHFDQTFFFCSDVNFT
ncbi:chitin-binding protein [Sphaerisporangium rufum]|uniref:Chitin-binding protein n=1 Tax=Sphaerisporangium rufum TaxID=1381558 RepID=A0A919R0Z8_9ACTN|nr:lytic polysaccharide monooxygenase [Sphaerisporangium rufum]GII76988.1 chitin-binding protein [Sphaerisporangium rufum]